MTESEILNRVKQILDPYRFKHSLLVAQYAKDLAISNNLDPNKAYLAGLIHDVAKSFNDIKMVEYSQHNNKYTKYPNIKTLHGIASSEYARKEFAITDPEILEGVAMHVIPDKNCSKFSKLIFFADKFEPSRTIPKNFILYKELAINNIEKAFDEYYEQCLINNSRKSDYDNIYNN
jgi:predicted HD superfamily hydrolase involved in NAD metabolism